MGLQDSLSLIFTGIALAAMAIMGFSVFLENKHSALNRAFTFLSFVVVILSLVNYLTYNILLGEMFALWFLRCSMFFAVWCAFSFFNLSYTFYKKNSINYSRYRFFYLPLAFITSFLTLTPLVFLRVGSLSSEGRIIEMVTGPGILFFGLVITFFFGIGIIILIKKYFISRDIEKKQSKFLLVGIILTSTLLVFFNFILPVVFGNPNYVDYLALYLLPFIAFTFYTVQKHKLFHIKVVATASLIFVLSLVNIFEISFAQSTSVLFLKIFTFVLVIFFGTLLIKGVLREIEQRERFEVISKKLLIANQKLEELDLAKSEFMSIASHQLRTPLAGIVGYLSMLEEGDYGKLADDQTKVIKELYQASQRLVRLVNTFLNVTRIEAGRFTMNLTEANIVDVVTAEVKELQPTAAKKGIQLLYQAPTQPMMATVDNDKIRDVFLNLIDNAIKYTPEGSVSVFVEQQGDQAHFHTQDTGVGIAKGESEHLFEKFVRGSGIARVQPNGSGLGLYIVKKIVEAHHGKVWVESEGTGKGSTFHVLLPLKQAAPSVAPAATAASSTDTQAPAAVEEKR